MGEIPVLPVARAGEEGALVRERRNSHVWGETGRPWGACNPDAANGRQGIGAKATAASAPEPLRDYSLLTLMTFGRTFSALGSVSVRTPSLKRASALSA